MRVTLPCLQVTYKGLALLQCVSCKVTSNTGITLCARGSCLVDCQCSLVLPGGSAEIRVLPNSALVKCWRVAVSSTTVYKIGVNFVHSLSYRFLYFI